MTRWKASSIHLALSAVVASAVFALFVLVWYPPPLFGATGGTRLLRTILLVDVVLGPLLTLVVYKPGKRGLKFDLATIATLQVCALVYGLFVAFQARPAYIAVLPYRATLVRADELYPHDPAPAGRYAKTPLWGAEPVGVDDPSREAKRALLDDFLAGKPDIDYRPGYYVPLDQRMAAIAREAEPLQRRMESDAPEHQRYVAWLRERGRNTSDGLYVLPLITPVDELEVVLDARDASVVGFLPAPPPPASK
ncbi:type IV pilin accessory protein [Luteimonas sp. SJ-92]|uniref:Type IV pilin accessory protein n=1 Tax=Luteimonas salinisoli TaxID=2752307 RepID=A0A853JHJ5_9GAMM|nr:type IV pilin accessory protein [Luteimonas salinisoli]NZA28345.1 type IV pilin accessory protein [Luteimonas salinisoli]